VTRKPFLACALLLLTLWAVTTPPEEHVATGNGGQDQALYADSAAGLQSQMDELIHLIKSPEQQAFLSSLDTLAIPNSHEWFTAHFPACEEAGPTLKNYITPAGLQRLKDEHLFLILGLGVRKRSRNINDHEFISSDPARQPWPVAVCGTPSHGL
jgi:hypothetical protein